jgi:hypothetical protein
MTLKKYGSPKMLGEAWCKNEIQGEAIATTKGRYVLTATSEMIWNGFRGQVLVLRNPQLPFVIALRESAASLGKEAETAIKGALGRLTDPFLSGIKPFPFVKIHSLEDPSLLSCDVATLQPMVLDSVTHALDYELHRHLSNFKKDIADLEKRWQEEGDMLSLVGLSISEDLENRKFALYAGRRMARKPFE